MPGIFRYPKRRLKKLVKDGEYVEALKLAHEIEPDYSEDSDFMFILGSIYYILEDSGKALPYFEESLRLEPDDVEALTLKTNTHLALGQKDKAIDCCKKILKLEPKNHEAAELLEKLQRV